MSGLEVSGVSVRFGGVSALAGVDVAATRGEIVGLVGPNGAGKTTLLNVVTGMVGHAGRVLLLGEDVTSHAPHERARRGLRRMFQYGGLVPDESVLTNLLIAHHARRDADSVASSHALLDEVGADAAAGALVRDLPAGTSRLVELACVLAGDPSVLLLDEPTTGLSAAERSRLRDVIRVHHTRANLATLVVAHDMRFVMDLAHRIVVLDRGSVLAEGTPDEVRADDRVRRLYLGTS